MGTVTQRDLAHIQTQLGGSNPIGMNEYYRGGAYVPTTRSTLLREPSSGEYYTVAVSGSAYAVRHILPNNLWDYRWDNVTAGSGSGAPPASYTTGGYTYYKGTYGSRFNVSYAGSTDHWGIYRTSGSTTTINTGVPSSGAISLNDLLGAANP